MFIQHITSDTPYLDAIYSKHSQETPHSDDMDALSTDYHILNNIIITIISGNISNSISDSSTILSNSIIKVFIFYPILSPLLTP
jgi:hypothetical protein